MTTKIDYSKATDGTKVISDDPWLEPYADTLKRRFSHVQNTIKRFDENEGGLLNFSKGYEYFGFNVTAEGVQYREWLPSAHEVYLVGDFNQWSKTSHKLNRDEYGRWSIFIPNDQNGNCPIPHKSKIKIYLKLANGNWDYRIPAWIKRVEQTKENPVFDGVFWNPPVKYQFKHKAPLPPTDLRIYEAHVGMSSELPEISTYTKFKDTVLPMVKELGYNAIQLMAIMEHAYYASFGYQVTNFFAISSRFGTPEELMEMIDTAHEMGILVLLDVVHSHASKNVLDGLNQLDGSDHHYFHGGGRGNHDVWDSRLFNYGSWEVMRFLLSNLRFYVDVYGFDGFRFDGVTSMIYYHHGLAPACSYGDYFGPNVDEDGLSYLTMANEMLHRLNPNIITIAEEVTGLACLCRPVSEGGGGFDYRLGMGIPDKWIELVKDQRDEDWNMGSIAHMLSNRRYKEKNIAYAESHDQSLVGDKTLAFWLMDKEMYFHMSTLQPETPIIDRGMALHKMIRIITSSLGGDGYLNFMGNEFGHPEWVDFPREGNNNSLHHARRRWDLYKDKLLRYNQLRQFDIAMNRLEEEWHWLSSGQAFISCKHEDDKVIVFERAGLIFIFNFHPNKSFSDYRIGSGVEGKFVNALDSDREEFGGHCRIGKDNYHFTENFAWNDRPYSLKIYIPSRTCLVLKKVLDK
ncbi:1,4-alpha-glucan branching enzyme [Dictyostelium purpureum]|uniref:1,4-alpha-glucan branching enzyme n=1 Tax=Dictyostelium purpureum TaxID=5786 RepID=F0ZWZ2_DICPU|nr:1,4-alpha-glucan branching enzyme [Dictyostelium purpureum]EGC31539.1 1,4-alpha-glucan branching enzyme [Dictyostelium purpureum]|eukprot:XP_003291939.1 1,4-alpha-glucan branching enzyme [Dictyostelium purpureum]